MELQGSSSSMPCLGNNEIEVCKILLNLKKIIRQFDSIPPNLHWVGKKVRSPRHLTLNPNPLCHIYPEGRNPNLPFCFPVIRDDQKSHSKIAKKKTREDMLEKIEKLENNKKPLREALENVKNYHRKIVALNLKLKETKKQFQLPLLEDQGHPKLDDVDKDQPSNTDSCKQMSIKPFRGFDLHELPPLDDCDL